MSIGTDSEVGRLRSVLVHRPGAELNRITPRTRDRLRFDGLPWLARARREHDEFTAVLRERGVEVLYITELLQDVLEYQSAAEASIASVLADAQTMVSRIEKNFPNSEWAIEAKKLLGGAK